MTSEREWSVVSARALVAGWTATLQRRQDYTIQCVSTCGRQAHTHARKRHSLCDYPHATTLITEPRGERQRTCSLVPSAMQTYARTHARSTEMKPRVYQLTVQTGNWRQSRTCNNLIDEPRGHSASTSQQVLTQSARALDRASSNLRNAQAPTPFCMCRQCSDIRIRR